MIRILLPFFLFIIYSHSWSASLQQPVDKIINAIDPHINMGMMIVDLNTGETLYQRNANHPLIPASNMKLFSDAAALLLLGPDYHFESQLSTDARSLNQGILKGSLYLHLSGDPSFTQQNLDSLLSELTTWGIHEIKGNIILVSNHNVVNPYAPGIALKDLTYSYGAPIAPLMLDENRLTVTVNPARHVGELAVVEINQPNSGITIENQVKTKAKTAGCGIDYKMDHLNHLVLRGCIQSGHWAAQERIAIRNPLRYAQAVIKQRLSDLHIKLNGDVILGSSATDSLLLATHSSKPINQLMADTLKPSDNLYADSLYLHAAAILQGNPLSWSQAQPVIKKFLQQQTGINLDNANLTDGSGLSRQDLLTASQTVSLLKFLHERFPVTYEYISALPIAGQDGTLQRRLRKPTQQGLVRAKTGSMTGIMSLSGYLYTANAHTLAFAIYINTLPGTKPAVSGRYRSMVDQLCDFLLRQKPTGNQVAATSNAHTRVAFQQHPTHADRERNEKSKWRRIEYAVKKGLNDESVTVLFRNKQLELIDHSADVNKVWGVLTSLRKKYKFSVAMHDSSNPKVDRKGLSVLWVHSLSADKTRTWTLRDSMG